MFCRYISQTRFRYAIVVEILFHFLVLEILKILLIPCTSLWFFLLLHQQTVYTYCLGLCIALHKLVMQDNNIGILQ
jgi:hypothetical protein